MPHHQNEKISEFFLRIEERKAEQENTLPETLKPLIKLVDLNSTYTYLLEIENQKKIEKILEKGKPYRLDKKTTGLARTLNFIVDPVSKDIVLILETKRKVASNRKNLKTKTFSGSFKTTKVAWRIDSEIPQKMANAVYYIDKNASLSDAQKEAMAAQKVVNANSGVECYINVPALGSVIAKAGTREKDKVNYTKKQSFYSIWASGGSLDHFMESHEFKSLNIQQVDTMAVHLLTSLIKLHQAGMIHQDIKPDNILVFKNELDEYRLELADFGKVYIKGGKVSGNSDVHATPQYESPEIAALNKKSTASDHEHYFNQDKPSYGRDIGQHMNSFPTYALPHAANDMWAIGIVLHELYYKTKPDINQKTQLSRLISGLLEPDRNKRLNADNALVVALKLETTPIAQPVAIQEKPFFSTNAGFHPGYKSTKIKPLQLKKKSQFSSNNWISSWLGCGKKRKRT